MTLGTFILKLKAEGMPEAQIFDEVISAVESTKAVLLDEVEAGEIEQYAAMMQGFDVAFDNIMDDLAN